MKVMVGVSGGIAAYKAAEVVRALQKQALEVRVTMTDAAQRFVQPLTFAALTGHKVVTSLWPDSEEPGAGQNASQDTGIEHIAEAQWADALVVAPATAGILAKFAHGMADDFLTAMYLATTAPVLVAPAMNVNMWEHPATQANLELLRQRGVKVIEPGSGELACGMVGPGRMAEPEFIANAVLNALGRSHDLAGETVLITAGGTREALDPVRFLGNRSSGKMGYALAEAAASRGAQVVLVSAASLPAPKGVEVVPVVSAEEMRAAVLRRMPATTIVLKAAAVADFRVSSIAATKLRRTSGMMLELETTPDIVAEVVARRRPGTLVVAFAAETHDALASGRAKLQRKGVDAIVVNDVSAAGIGFDSDRNAGTMLFDGQEIALPEMSKREMAERILDQVVGLRLRHVHPDLSVVALRTKYGVSSLRSE
jgi:phosphopantothenoylcysteine decarboxylase/phosphopantothenate--cysteine ligase